MMVAVVAQRAAPSEAAAEIQPVAAPRASGVAVHTADDQAASVVTMKTHLLLRLTLLLLAACQVV